MKAFEHLCTILLLSGLAAGYPRNSYRNDALESREVAFDRRQVLDDVSKKGKRDHPASKHSDASTKQSEASHTSKRPSSSGTGTTGTHPTTSKHSGPSGSKHPGTTHKPSGTKNNPTGTKANPTGTKSNDPKKTGDHSGGDLMWGTNHPHCEWFSAYKAADTKKLWDMVHGNEALKNFTETYNKDLLFCKQCRGLRKEDCPKQFQKDCPYGLKTASTHSWDSAISRWAGLEGANCDIGDGSCSSKDCDSSAGPSAYAVAKSVINLSLLVNKMSDAFRQAKNDAAAITDDGGAFVNMFAPEEDPLFPQWITTANSVFGAASGMAGFVPGWGVPAAVASYASGVGGGILSNMPDAGEQPHLGEFVDGIYQQFSAGLNKVTSELFQKGVYFNMDVTNLTMPDGVVTIPNPQVLSLENLIANGSFLQTDATKESYTKLHESYARVILQQAAFYAWANTPGDKLIPYIAFEHQDCGDDGGPLDDYIEGLNRTGSSQQLGDTCYYLLGAEQGSRHVEYVECGSQESTIFYCDGGHEMPGGTHVELRGGKAEKFFGLIVEDFIEPSVRGWEKHGKKNGYPPPGPADSIHDLAHPGMVQIPVCDYVNSPHSPGYGCPAFKDHQGNIGHCMTSKDNKWAGASSGDRVGSAVHAALQGIKDGKGKGKGLGKKEGNNGSGKGRRDALKPPSGEGLSHSERADLRREWLRDLMSKRC